MLDNGGDAAAFGADVSVEGDVQKLVEHGTASFDGLDVVVANARSPVDGAPPQI